MLHDVAILEKECCLHVLVQGSYFPFPKIEITRTSCSSAFVGGAMLKMADAQFGGNIILWKSFCVSIMNLLEEERDATSGTS